MNGTVTEEVATNPALERDADYFDAPGLSQSGMKDLAVSPLRYWHLHINPERPKDEPTPTMIFGSALHSAVFEASGIFESKYAKALDLSQYPEALDTMQELRTWIKDKGGEPKGTRKADVIAQVQKMDPDAPIVEVMLGRHAAMNTGRIILSVEDWNRLEACVVSLYREPRVKELLARGRAEVPMSAVDPQTGVLLKAKLDWLGDGDSFTADLKTFTQKHGRSIDQSVTAAIWYERYHIQGVHYDLVRRLHSGTGFVKGWTDTARHVMIFVESEPPHEVRIRTLRPKIAGETSMLWDSARHEVNRMIKLYAECQERFGLRPWRSPQAVEMLMDEDFPQLAYS